MSRAWEAGAAWHSTKDSHSTYDTEVRCGESVMDKRHEIWGTGTSLSTHVAGAAFNRELDASGLFPSAAPPLVTNPRSTCMYVVCMYLD